MRKLLSIAALGTAVLVSAPQAQAQILPLSFEVRGGAAFPTGDFGDGGIETGWGFEANAKFQLLPMVAVYGAYDRFSFGVENVDDLDLTDSGFAVGGQLSVPLVGMATGLSPWVRAGALFNKLEVGENETDSSLGFEIGGGVSFPLGQVISVTPGVRYRTYSPEFEGEGIGYDVSYFIVDVGLSFGL